ncbi:MAG: hypothetical protein HFG86_07740 [Dorea sp.]|nr:hypothetical protein [Dorea sp.]
MVGGISAVNPYAGRYAGYVRPSAALQGARSVDAVSRSAYGQPVQGVRGVGAAAPVSGVAAGREVNGASTVPVPGVSAGQGAGAASGVSAGQGAGAAAGVTAGQRAGVVSGVTAGQWIGAGGAVRGASPGTPVEPVSPIGAVNVNGTNGIANTIPFLRKGMDPAELAVRMRIQYADPSKEEGAGVDAAQKAAEDAECQTCKERKYQDGSDDAGVSFKTPTHISPDQAASAVKGHEMEHVVRERAAAKREDRRVVSQSVTMHTSICPECGRVYVSGGTTRTTTASKPDTAEAMQQQDGKNFSAAA